MGPAGHSEGGRERRPVRSRGAMAGAGEQGGGACAEEGCGCKCGRRFPSTARHVERYRGESRSGRLEAGGAGGALLVVTVW